MISTRGKYYLYRHVRLDTNEVFYVGIGKRRSDSVHAFCYNRAIQKNRRSKFWKNIASKTEVNVDVLLESDDVLFIKEKEKEFIELYGRRDKGVGTLVNMTDGGDGAFGYKLTPEQKEKRQGRMGVKKGFKHTEEAKRNMSASAKGRIYSDETREKIRLSNIKTKGSKCKFTDQQILEIRHMYSSGNYTQKQIAEVFGTYGGTVSAIVNHKLRKTLFINIKNI